MSQMQATQEIAVRSNGDAGAMVPEVKGQPLTVKALFGGSKTEELRKVCGKALSAEKIVKMFAIAASRTPKLMQCTALSVLDCMVKCAELRLGPDPLGSVYLIPFENRNTKTVECTMIVGYRGYLCLARRSGEISTVQAEVVRTGDVFEYEYGIAPTFRHKPAGDMEKAMTHVWAMAKFKDGGHQIIVMTKSEIDAIRKRSKSSNFGPWVTDYAEMAKKTALRRLSKYLPLAPDDANALATVDRSEFDLDLPDMPSGQGDDESDQNGTRSGSAAALLADMGKKPEPTPAPARGAAEAGAAQSEARGEAPNAAGEQPSAASNEPPFKDDGASFLESLAQTPEPAPKQNGRRKVTPLPE